MTMRTPVIVGLAAAAGMGLLARPSFPPRSLPLTVLPLIAVTYVLTVLLATAIVLLVAYFVQARPAGFYQVALRTAAAAVWMAPLVLLFYWRSLWATAAIVALLASIAGLWNIAERGGRFISALSISTFLQLAIVAALAGYARMAALMSGVGTALFLWVRPDREWKRFTLPRALPRIVLAIMLTVIALAPYVKLTQGSDGSLLEAFLDGEAARRTGDSEKETKAKTQGIGAGSFPGVILWPDEAPQTMLVPPPPSTGRGFGRGARRKPLSIPFYGVYWFFNVPDRQPPPNSIVARGSTMKTVYRSVNPVALRMEAHQNLGALMDLTCCRKIEVAIDNADPLSEWIALELLLFNTALPALPPLSLGRILVSKAREQTLSFPVPAHSVVQQFDKVTMRFHRGPKQWQKSVKIAIKRFVLVP